MRFFTKELWRGAQVDADGKNQKKWASASKRYMTQLEKLRPRLTASTFEFFATADVHDGELMSFQITDGSRPAPMGAPSRPWRTPTTYPVKASLSVLDAHDKYLWTLRYSTVRRVAVDYPSEQPLFYRRGQGFSDWGYHELTAASEGFLRHEVLFASGATLLLEFQSVAISREKKNGNDA